MGQIPAIGENGEFYSAHIPCSYQILHANDLCRTIGYREPGRTETRMAQKVQTLLIDDLDGSEAEGTVLFGLDGTQYEIDLSTDHAKELRATLTRYIDAGRRVTGATRRAGQNGRRTPASSISNTEVRTWAKAQGLEVKERGRVSADILARYRAATGN